MTDRPDGEEIDPKSETMRGGVEGTLEVHGGDEDQILDLLVVGAGPTGIAIGAAASRRGLKVLVMDQGPLCASLQAYPADLTFFTTRERMEIADVPFTIPDVKANRRQALVYYREVVRLHDVPLALYEKVLRIVPPPSPEASGTSFHEASPEASDTSSSEAFDTSVHEASDTSPEASGTPVPEASGTPVPEASGTSGNGLFRVETERQGGHRRAHRARAVAIATGYFWTPRLLGVPGEDLPWVKLRYVEPYPHMGQHVLIVGGGNSAAKTALDLWRNGSQVTIVHRRSALKPSVKYWILPDVENRIAEGSIGARFDSRVVAFHDGPERRVEIETVSDGGAGATTREMIEVDEVYLLIGYVPDVELEREAGIEVDPETAIPTFDPETCETNVPGLYVAGTVQAGKFTDRIFIENSRDHGHKIVGHLERRLRSDRHQRTAEPESAPVP